MAVARDTQQQQAPALPARIPRLLCGLGAHRSSLLVPLALQPGGVHVLLVRLLRPLCRRPLERALGAEGHGIGAALAHTQRRAADLLLLLLLLLLG